MTITPNMKLEREETVAIRVLLVIYDDVYVCIYKVYSSVLKEYTSHAFVYDGNFSLLEKS